MNALRASAAGVGLLGGALASYVGYASRASFGAHVLLVALGVALVADSAVCFLGWRTAFAGSAALSALLVVVALATWGSSLSAAQSATVAVASASLLLALLAFRSSSSIPEQANPMNLPVFG